MLLHGYTNKQLHIELKCSTQNAVLASVL